MHYLAAIPTVPRAFSLIGQGKLRPLVVIGARMWYARYIINWSVTDEKSTFFPVFHMSDYTVDQATVNAEVAQNGKTKVTATYQLTFDSQQDQVQIPLPDGDISRVSAETYRYKVDKTDAGVDVVLSKGTFSGT